MALFDGLMILGLISSAKQLIKEAMEPTLPANARIDWVQIYEDRKNGMSEEVYAKRMRKGYYHTTEPKKYFDLMAYRQDVLDGATPDELEQNRKNLKYNYVKPAGYSIYQNWELWDGHPSDLIIDVERYEYERRKNPEYFESLGYIPKGANYFNFTDERLWRLEKRSLESWFESEKYLFLNYMNWGDTDGTFELNSDPRNYEISTRKKNQSSGQSYEFMIGFSADKIEYFQVNHLYTLSELLRNYFWKMEWIHGNMGSFFKECSPWEKYSDISLTLEERENEKTFAIVEGKIYRGGYSFYMRGKVGPLSAETKSLIKNNFNYSLGKNFFDISLPLVVAHSLKVNVFDSDCNRILKEYGFTDVLVIQSGLSVQIKANKNSRQYGVYLGCSERAGVQNLQSLFKDCIIALCKADENLLTASFWDKLEQLADYQINEYSQEKSISDFEMFPKLASEISYMGNSYDLRIGWVMLDTCTDVFQEAFSLEEKLNESAFYKTYDAMLSECGFQKITLQEEKNRNLLTTERDNIKYGISLECEVGSAAENKMHIVFFDCMKTLCDIQNDISLEKYEASLSTGGRYHIKRLDTIASVPGFETTPFVNVSVYGWSNYYTLKVVQEPANGEINLTQTDYKNTISRIESTKSTDIQYFNIGNLIYVLNEVIGLRIKQNSSDAKIVEIYNASTQKLKEYGFNSATMSVKKDYVSLMFYKDNRKYGISVKKLHSSEVILSDIRCVLMNCIFALYKAGTEAFEKNFVAILLHQGYQTGNKPYEYLRARCSPDFQENPADLFNSQTITGEFLYFHNWYKIKVCVEILDNEPFRPCKRIVTIQPDDIGLSNNRAWNSVVSSDTYENIADTNSITHQLKSFDSLNGHEFEKFCADLLKNNNYENVQITSGSGDQGIDIIAYKDDIKYGIQCKCYSTDVGNKAVQEVFSGKTFYQCHVAVVLTNSFFTNSAIELARKNGVILWDRDKLMKLIEKARENER